MGDDDKPILNQGEELVVEKIADRVVEAFQSRCPAVLHVQEMTDELKKLSTAVLGNGRPEKSLLARIARQEDVTARLSKKRAMWFDRAWKVAMSVAMGLFAWALKG